MLEQQLVGIRGRLSAWLVSALSSCVGASLLIGAMSAEATATNWERIGQLLRGSNEQMRWRSFAVSGVDVRGGEVDGLISAPYDECLALLRDYDQYRRFLPFFTGSRTVSRSEEGAEIVLRARIMRGIVNLRSRVQVREEALDRGRRFTLRQRQGNLSRLDVSWTLIPLNEEETVIRMRLLLDPDLMLVPDSRLSKYNLVNGRRTIRSIRERLRALARRRPQPAEPSSETTNTASPQGETPPAETPSTETPTAETSTAETD